MSSKPSHCVVLFTLLAVAGCTSAPGKDFFTETIDSLHAKNSPLRAGYSGPAAVTSASSAAQRFNGAQYQGTGQFVSSGAPVTKVTSDGSGKFELNLVNAPIADAAKAVLGDALHLNYIVDPRVQGTVTLQTSQPVSQDALVDILQSALAVNAAGITSRAGTYQIVPLSEIMASTPPVSVPSTSPSGPGVKVQVLQLQFIAADEMKTILEPITRQGSVLRVDSTRNIITVAGSDSDLNAIREAVSVFDVDWMRGMSVALHPLKTSKPEAVAAELDSIFGTKEGPGAKLIQFIPNDRLNSVLVITSRPAYLARAATWINKLDRLAETNESQLFVYQIQNRPAKELASVLSSVLGTTVKTEGQSGGSNVAPDQTPIAMQSDGVTPAPLTGPSPSLPQQDNQAPAHATVVADVENNALLIQTTARDYQRIEQILSKVDVLPTQVMLEAVIAEVTLNDDLKYGLRWFFENGGTKVSVTDVAKAAAAATLPGFNWSYATDNIQVTLNALSKITDVNVISAPTIMALNNQKAILQVGDQVPILTQQSQDTGNGSAPIINSVQMKDTGVILTVTPRINNAGRVMLDIQQEVSNVTKTDSSDIDSPTIQQRKVQTRVLVNDGESLALGGLIQQNNSVDRSQVPILGDIPILGNAFKQKDDTIRRTELIIFIRPHVVRDINEAREVTDEFRGKISLQTPIQKRRGGTKLQQDLKRLAY
ncbi:MULTISPECIES: type II secretion system secretin GspD [Mesorhizobium]|uniref:Type II secretion system protein GspD n=3 Tax=Mesorhizobium TaxID=68287 RepID=A0A1A5HME7_RHILI|nr:MULTISPECIES: type II secretion system secretin GspD [Mesorhizobium]ETA71445.1 type II secretion system protein D (GspD) [Mesorhizobium japonicum R7A]MBE1708278.1 type II secretion system secretin GspD [Mesorhizobium japonicum]MBE1713447.1 type II secretion system secretin GspD [Mesorhizobium japonicum]MUT25486.1 type II secretion system protein GspD [Mesorhizobium japonicum]MUT31548.1 type II secretion system protein GspD [Mesorhizobium japonicum]